MPFIHSRRRKRIWLWCLVLLFVGIAGGVLAWPYARVQYHRWSAQRLVRKAAGALAQGDPRLALLDARTALRHSPRDAGATRIIAQSLEALGASEAAEWRAKLDLLQPGDAENVLARAGAALKTSGAEAAEQMLMGLDPAARKSVAFHSVAAAVAMEKRDTASAEAHWAEALRLEPEEKRYQLNLASVRLESKTPGARESALAALREMRQRPATSIEALRLLLADAIRRSEAPAARETAEALVADQRCAFTDKLARLTTLRHFQDAASGPYLLELRDAAVSDPAALYTLLIWMNANDLSLMVAEWVRRMSPEIIAKPPVCLGIAEAYLRVGDWQKLEVFTGAAKWAEMDYLRRAFLARALERLGEEEESTREWTEAVSLARGRADALERLARFAVQMKWDRRAGEIMWTLTALPQSPRWVTDSLWQDAFRRGDTAHLQKLSSLMAKKDPTGFGPRNNYAFLSLLLRTDEGNPHRVAENLHREYPENALITSTYGLSLYQKGKAEEAAALMAALKPEDLRQPQVALYYAIFLIAAGHAERAEEYVNLSAKWPMLPEEKALLDRVKAARASEAGSGKETSRPAPTDKNPPMQSGGIPGTLQRE